MNDEELEIRIIIDPYTAQSLRKVRDKSFPHMEIEDFITMVMSVGMIQVKRSD